MESEPNKNQKCTNTMSANDEVVFWVLMFVCLVNFLN